MFIVQDKSNVHFNVWFCFYKLSRSACVLIVLTVSNLLQVTLQTKSCLPVFFSRVFVQKRDEVEKDGKFPRFRHEESFSLKVLSLLCHTVSYLFSSAKFKVASEGMNNV
jgi:hypothetical protein